MAAAKIQSVTGSGATLTLNSVVAGNGLTMKDSYFRNPTTGLAEAIPTDTNGTWALAKADNRIKGGFDTGIGQFYLQNAAAGTHTVTPESQGAGGHHDTSLTEYSGMKVSGMLNDSNTGGNVGLGTSQPTGSTAAASTSAIGDLAEIAFAMSAENTGSTNVALVDPVPNYTTLQILQNDATGVAMMHSFQVLTTSGVQWATFNWSLNEADQWWQASIVTYNAVIGVIPSTGAYQQEQNTTDRYQLEDGSGVYLIEPWGTAVTQFPPRWWGDLDGIGKSFPRDRLN